MSYKSGTINSLKKTSKVVRPVVDIFTDHFEVKDYKSQICQLYDKALEVEIDGKYPAMESLMRGHLRMIHHYQSLIDASKNQESGGSQRPEGNQVGAKKESAPQYKAEAPRTATITVDQNFIDQYLQNEKRSNEVFDNAINKMYEATNVTQYAEKDKIKTIMENMQKMYNDGEQTKRAISADAREVEKGLVSALKSRDTSYMKLVNDYVKSADSHAKELLKVSEKGHEKALEMVQKYGQDLVNEKAKTIEGLLKNEAAYQKKLEKQKLRDDKRYKQTMETIKNIKYDVRNDLGKLKIDQKTGQIKVGGGYVPKKKTTKRSGTSDILKRIDATTQDTNKMVSEGAYRPNFDPKNAKDQMGHVGVF